MKTEPFGYAIDHLQQTQPDYYIQPTLVRDVAHEYLRNGGHF